MMKEKFKQRTMILRKDKELNLLKKQQQKIGEEEKLANKKALAVDKLMSSNVMAWISVDEAKEYILKVEDGNKVSVLLAQINFHRYVMNVKCNNKLFVKTKVENCKRVDLTWSELVSKFEHIILAIKSPVQNIHSLTIKPQDVRDAAVEKQKNELMCKIREARLDKVKSQQKSNMLPQFYVNPELLVGKRIRHSVREEDSEEVNWQSGKVISIDEVK